MFFHLSWSSLLLIEMMRERKEKILKFSLSCKPFRIPIHSIEAKPSLSNYDWLNFEWGPTFRIISSPLLWQTSLPDRFTPFALNLTNGRPLEFKQISRLHLSKQTSDKCARKMDYHWHQTNWLINQKTICYQLHRSPSLNLSKPRYIMHFAPPHALPNGLKITQQIEMETPEINLSYALASPTESKQKS